MALGSTAFLPPLLYRSPPLHSSFKKLILVSTSFLPQPHSHPLLKARLFTPFSSSSNSLSSATSPPLPLIQSEGKISSFSSSSSVNLFIQIEDGPETSPEEEDERRKPPLPTAPVQETEPAIIIAPLPSFPIPELTIKEKKELASYAHSLGKKLKSQQIGKSGVTSSVAAAMVESLESNELLKLKVHGSCPGELSDVIKQLESSTGSTTVSQIGRTLILYRPSPAKMKQEDAKRSRTLQQRTKIPSKSVAALSVRRKGRESGTFS